MDLIVEEMQMAVGITEVVAVEVERAFVAQPFAHINVVVGIDVKVITEVFAPGERRRQFVGAAVERELEVIIGTLTKMIEPLILVGLGGVIGFVMIAMYLPMFMSAGGAG